MKRCGLALSLCLALLAPAPALAVSAEDIVRPWQDDIAMTKRAIDELARQGAQRLSELGATKALHAAMTQALADNVAALDLLQQRDQANEERFVSGAGALRVSGGEQSWVPHIGWGIFGFFEKHRDDTNKAIAEVDAQIAAGDAQFFILGLGWQSGKSLAALVAADQKAMDDLQAALGAGTWQIFYPGIGWADRNGLEARIAGDQKQIDDTLAVIAKGEYQVFVPQLGWVTRNAVNQQIESAKAELAAVEAQFQAGDAQIWRAIGGWITTKSVQGAMDGLAKQQAALEAAAQQGSFVHYLPLLGWVDGRGIDATIQARQDEVAKVQDSAAAGTYAVPSGCCGWLDGNNIQRLLALPDCVPNGPSPCLNPADRPHVQDAQRRLGPSIALDIAVREAEIALFKAWRAALAGFIEPQVKIYQEGAAQWARTQAEFDIELAAIRQRIEDRIAFLHAVLDRQIP
jgi:hypothetical protein